MQQKQSLGTEGVPGTRSEFSVSRLGRLGRVVSTRGTNLQLMISFPASPKPPYGIWKGRSKPPTHVRVALGQPMRRRRGAGPCDGLVVGCPSYLRRSERCYEEGHSFSMHGVVWRSSVMNLVVSNDRSPVAPVDARKTGSRINRGQFLTRG